MRISRFIGGAVAAVVFLLASSPVWAQGTGEKEAKAIEAAKAWLQLVDKGKFGESWDAAAFFFKSQVARDKWDARLANSRVPLGRVLSRTLSNQMYTTQLENAPKAEYVIVRFDTAYDGGKKVETVIPVLEKDGVWRVCGFSIKPPEK